MAGGMQEMMKAMMGGSVTDEDMAEVQSAYHSPLLFRHIMLAFHLT